MDFGVLPTMKKCDLCKRGFRGEPGEHYCTSCRARLDSIVERVFNEIGVFGNTDWIEIEPDKLRAAVERAIKKGE